MKSLIRTIIIIALIGGLGYFGYTKFFAGSATAPTSALQTTQSPAAGGSVDSSGNPVASDGTSASTVGDLSDQEFLSQLLSIQSVKLDTSIFTDKAFSVLQDFNREIPADNNPGRPNPFAPIGSDGGAVSTQVTTSNASSITTTTSILNGTLTITDPSAMRWFEYGLTPALGTLTTPRSQPTAGAFAETINGLTPDTLYYVKAGATINGLEVSGNVITWRTAQAASTPKKK